MSAEWVACKDCRQSQELECPETGLRDGCYFGEPVKKFPMKIHLRTATAVDWPRKSFPLHTAEHSQ